MALHHPVNDATTMKRSASAVWTLLAVVLIGLLLLVDPFGWFGGARVETPLAAQEASVPASVDEPGVKLGGGTDLPDLDHDVATEREAIDPLAEAGIAAFRVLHWTGHVVPDAQVLIFRGEELAAQLGGTSALGIDVSALTNSLNALIYATFIAVTLLYQGGMARYFLRRRAMIDSYLQECPEWARRVVEFRD